MITENFIIPRIVPTMIRMIENTIRARAETRGISEIPVVSPAEFIVLMK